MKKIFTYIFIFVVIYNAFWSQALAHSWRTNWSWCHNDRKNWWYHCHNWWWSSSKSSSSRSFSCPSHSSSDWNWSCTCDLWYKPNSSFKSCIKDMDYQCSSKYYWTIYRSFDKMCICPWDKWKSTWGKGKLFC